MTIQTEKVENGSNSRDDDYNPFEHRNMTHANSTIGSLANLVKSLLGSGILAIPMAFKNAGLLVGTLGTIVVGLICTHCVHILVKTSQEVCKKAKIPSVCFAEIAEKVFETGPPAIRKYAPFARWVTDYGLVMTYLGANCVYILFIATSLSKVVNYGLGVNWDVRFYIAIVFVPCIILGEIRKLKYLVPFSAIATLCLLMAFGITFYFIITGPLEIRERPSFSSWGQLPLFFSIVVFAMEVIGVVMPIENSMKRPQYFLGCPGVLNSAMFAVICLYSIVGFLGYARYGDDVGDSITLNLPPDLFVAQAAQIFVVISLLSTFSLAFYVPMDILWRKLAPTIPKEKHHIFQIIFRAGIIMLMGCVAAAVPKLGPFIDLVGAIFFSLLGLCIPALIETVFRYPDNLGRGNWILIKNGFLIVFSIFALVTGAYASILEIIRIYKPDE